MKEFMTSSQELLDVFKSDEKAGLSSTQVSENAQKYGINEFTRTKPDTLIKRILKASKEPMIIMLIMAGFIALAVNIIRGMTGSETDYLEVVGVFTAILLSVVITVVMEGKSAKAFEALSKINEDTEIKALRNNATVLLNQKEIVCGDILLLATGDRIPGDGRLLESTEVKVDESVLTGESNPAKKDAEYIIIDDQTPLADRDNMLYSGTYLINGYAKMIVTAVGDKTEFGKIAQALTKVQETSTPLQEKLNRLGKLITVFGVIAATIVFIAQFISFSMHDGLVIEEVLEAFVTSIVLIVAAVPEGLPTIVAVSLSINIIKLSKQNALVKKMIASETVGCINVICSDKTGTLTENKMSVISIFDGSIISPEKLKNQYLINNFCLNSTADIDELGGFIGNPTEGAMLIAAKKAGIDYHEVRQHANIVKVFPFSSDVKHMTTIIKNEGDAICFVKGSPECIIEMCQIEPKQKTVIENQITTFQQKAYRLIALAHKKVSLTMDYEQDHLQLESNMHFDGFVAIADPLRRDISEAVENCFQAGISLKMLTGDNIITATTIANELKILDNNHIAVEAKQIEQMSDDKLIEMLPSISVIARSTPSIKMRVVKLLKEMGNVVAVTGDGINDAPALKNADVGIAMGISGTEVSKEASDIVLLNDSFTTIVNAIQWGRSVYENFKRFICFQLTVNISSVIVVLTSILLGLKAPFTALQLLWINIIMDGPPALTLGLEPSYHNLMEKQPTKRSDNIISNLMLIKIIVTGLYISIIFLLQYKFNFLQATDNQMITVLFTLFALFQLFNAFNCRELHNESIFKNILKNKLMLIVVSATFILQILIIQFAGAFFGTVPLPLDMWIKIFGITITVVIGSELIKLIIRLIKKI